VTINSLLPALPYATEAAFAFRRAVESVVRGDLAAAATYLDGLRDAPLRAHFNEALSAASPQIASLGTTIPARVDRSLRERSRMPDARGKTRVFARDGWRCRWCSTPVLSTDALKAMARKCSPHFWHASTDAERHGLTLCCAASLDHVVPHAGGGTNAPENLVTACWPCQFGRGEVPIVTLDLSDPRLRPAIVDDWDGCSRFR